MSVPRCASLKERQLVRKTRPGRIRTAPRLRELPRERENSLDGLRVLVVEDEPLIRRAVAEARHDVHPVFGRLICWLTFSAGAEYLGKGLCLAHGIQFWNDARPAKICELPEGSINDWLKKTKGRPKRKEERSFGTIGGLTWEEKGNPSPLEQLARKFHAQPEETHLLLGAYTVLGSTIRNRDAHAYVPNVRASHFWLVDDLFMPALNLLIEWIPKGEGQLVNEWQASAGKFIQGLK
jgi:hypothetical protein